MRQMMTWIMILSAALLLQGATMTNNAGTSKPATTQSQPAGRLLVDHAGGTTARPHCTNVPDPFGGTGTVIHGEVVEEGKNKTTYINGKGFFTVPPDGRGEVVLRYAVRKEANLRIALVNEAGQLKSFYPKAPAFNQWCEAVLPLKELAGKINAGDKIVDISVWQMGGGKEAGLWVDRITIRGE